MKIRMVVVTRDGKQTFEHAGPVVHVGREPGIELLVDADKVSRRHAKIELATDGATITDLKSSNGTLLNDQPLEPHVPAALHVGDRVQLGRTGATVITVIELDLAEARPEPAKTHHAPKAAGRGKTRRFPSRLVAVVVALAVLAPAGVGAYFLVFNREAGRRIWRGGDEVAVPHAGDRHFALLVGVQDYKGSLTPLKFAANDVEELADVLRPLGYNVTLLTEKEGKTDPSRNPTAANVLRHVHRAAESCRDGDTLLVAFAGHGLHLVTNDKAQSYFCPIDTRIDPAGVADRTTLVPVNDVYEALNTKGAGTKFLLIDACRNEPDGIRGKVKPRRGVDSANTPPPARGVAALFSCSPTEFSFEKENLGTGHGVFFYYLLQGLKGEAKENGKGPVTWESLSGYVRKHVSDTVPKLMGHGAKQNPETQTNLAGRPPVLVPFEAPSFNPVVTVGGKVLRGGKPVEQSDSVKLRVTLFTTTPPRSFVAEAKPDGTFEILGIPSGEYRVAVELLVAESNVDKLGGKFSRVNTRLFHLFKAHAPVLIDLEPPDS